MAIRPILLSERRPGPKDCLEIKRYDGITHHCWLGYSTRVNGEELLSWGWKWIPVDNGCWWHGWDYWLPASTKYLPARMEG